MVGELQTQIENFQSRYDILIRMKLPDEYINRMKIQLGESFLDYEKTLHEDNIRALRVNTLKGSVRDFLQHNGWGITDKDRVDWCPIGFYIGKDEELPNSEILPPGKHPYHSAGVYYIQEPSAMSVVEQLEITPGDRVLDLCAAPGGKTTQIAAKLQGKGILFANEPVATRAKILAENVERMGITNCVVISHDPAQIAERFKGYFDKILVDAPCSGEGMFRKNEEAVQEWSEDNVSMCASRQKQILDSAVIMLRGGGKMVYSTCTFSKEEDEENASYVVSKYPFMTMQASRRIWPHECKGEGHFWASFAKESDGVLNKAKCDKGLNVKTLQEFAEFERLSLKRGIDNILQYDSKFLKFGDELYVTDAQLPTLDKLKVLRSGLHLGTLKKNRFEPSLALALAIKPEDATVCVSLSEHEARAYLRGESINREVPKGWCVLEIDGYTLGWGKASAGIIKNHYPKGLRNYY